MSSTTFPREFEPPRSGNLKVNVPWAERSAPRAPSMRANTVLPRKKGLRATHSARRTWHALSSTSAITDHLSLTTVFKTLHHKITFVFGKGGCTPKEVHFGPLQSSMSPLHSPKITDRDQSPQTSSMPVIRGPPEQRTTRMNEWVKPIYRAGITL